VSRRPAALVVLGWGFLNALLALGLVVAGGYWQEFGVYLIAVLIPLGIGCASLLAWSRRPRRPRRFGIPGHAGCSSLGAAAALCTGLGFVYGWWFGLLALPCLCGAVWGAVRGFKVAGPVSPSSSSSP
jgi:hypothetical protein